MAQRVFVGLSGGVDSSTTAALLKERGYDVTGVFIRIWRPEFLECTWKEDQLDAMRVAAFLGIPFREVDLSAEYERDVVQTMIRDYQAGITPNPDVLCNETVKFGAFLTWALEHGAERIATGHYARVAETADGHRLLRGLDETKDQSYFLYRLGQEELAHTLFPIGEFRKEDVRRMATHYELPVAQKPDSQGLCFVGDVSIPEFLQRFITVTSGDVLDTTGNRIGRHDGAAFYTVGQRHGFTVEGSRANVPQYVVRVDVQANTLTVSPDKADTLSHTTRIEAPHWIGKASENGARLVAHVRYHAPDAEATLSYDGNAAVLAFDAPQVVSPGQAVVLYEDDICLGGGPASGRTAAEIFKERSDYENPSAVGEAEPPSCS
jgi:tRNA-specific 2-thiouridylase